MIVSVIILLIGFVILIFGANFLVDGASSLAKKYHIPDLVIGLTIVAFGTSAPELIVNILAASKGYSDIVFGNVIGSNNFNLFIILGITGLITPLMVQNSTAKKEIPISLVAIVLVYLLANDVLFSTGNQPDLNRWDGILLFIGFLGFLFYIYKQLKSDQGLKEEIVSEPVKHNTIIITYIILGLVGLIWGGKLVVDYAVKIAEDIGISERIIGITIVAAGTSLPELATSITAALKKNADIAVGNIIGSNIFNFLLIFGAAALVRPINYPMAFNMDLYLLLGGTILTLIFMRTGRRKCLDRWEAAILLIGYLSYLVFIVL